MILPHEPTRPATHRVRIIYGRLNGLAISPGHCLQWRCWFLWWSHPTHRERFGWWLRGSQLGPLQRLVELLASHAARPAGRESTSEHIRALVVCSIGAADHCRVAADTIQVRAPARFPATAACASAQQAAAMLRDEPQRLLIRTSSEPLGFTAASHEPRRRARAINGCGV